MLWPLMVQMLEKGYLGRIAFKPLPRDARVEVYFQYFI